MAIRLKVAGMTCGGCVRAVETALTAQQAQAVKIDLAAGLVCLDGLSANQATMIIEDAGFSVTAVLEG